MPTTECECQLRIPSETDNLELIREFVTKVAEKVGFNLDDTGNIELACDEACTNVIKHAYSADKNDGKNSLDILIKVVLTRDLLSSDAEVIGQFVHEKVRQIDGILSTQTLIPGTSKIKE